MRFKKLDLNLLVALDHMIELRSVSAAANKMFMSQSAMSNALTRLRDYFDDPLLVQVGRRMEITPRAESMRPAIRDILVRIEATIESQPEFQPDVSTRAFNVLLSDYSLRVFMPTVFRLLNEQKSTVRINLHPQNDAPHTLLERGEIDFLLVPEMFMSPDHPSDVLFEDEYVCVAWAHGKYGNGPMDKAAYMTAPHAVMVPPHAARSLETSLLMDAEIERNVDVKTYSLSTLPHIITGTNRIATIHKRLAKLVAHQAELSIHPLPVELPNLRQMLQSHAYREHDPGVIWLRNLFQRAAVELP